MIGMQIEFDETGQQVQVRENSVKVLGTFEVMAARRIAVKALTQA